jgi:hypothetical protein
MSITRLIYLGATLFFLLGLTFTANTAPANAETLMDEQAVASDLPAFVEGVQDYSDEKGFAERRQAVLEALTLQDLGAYRRGYFSGGDPGKYLPGHAMARMIVLPEADEAIQLMNDDRSYREHYHFAATNWARFLPLFGEKSLTPGTKQNLAEQAFRYSAYLNGGGTENHKTMWITSANVLPTYLQGDRGLAHQSKEQSLEQSKQQLRHFVKGLYAAGAGEWDSPTYSMFTGHGLMNIIDFSEDPEARLLAQAGLDWIVSYYALKHVDGLFVPPNQRGHYREAYDSIVDQTGYLWWGGDRRLDQERMKTWRYAIHPATSNYRPNEVITDIANRRLPGLPVELRNSKPNYWFGQNQKPQAGVYPETLYIDQHFTMGSLWSGHSSQITRFGIGVDTDQGGVLITGGHPRKSDHTGKKIDHGYGDGISRYLQSAQAGQTYLALAQIPEDEPIDYMFVSIPPDTRVISNNEWMTYPIGKVTIAVRGIGGQAEIGKAQLTTKQEKQNDRAEKKGNPLPHQPADIVMVRGRQVGFVVEVLNTLDEKEIQAALNVTQLDEGSLASDAAVKYLNSNGRSISLRFNPDPNGDRHGDRRAEASIDGNPVDYETWPIASGPFIEQEPGRLSVYNGKDGFVIDFTGEEPVYSSWKKHD